MRTGVGTVRPAERRSGAEADGDVGVQAVAVIPERRRDVIAQILIDTVLTEEPRG
ncbi:hypothetical protein [Streptomyces scopuliridis]|uniref:Uncharacterized protein n=1 Tax=Streptomyces scopuliridis TaxID=452529 RepID=A0ACD4ZDA6_9ACTN|nr:hypothetical protein [Streptomyces scopuliridis]WSB96429.1 hypothetical protein OG835_05070 [Streptomyces scopuliridis]